ncbi:MAG: CHAT domain-containing protein [Oscillochloris sp.]|nr:CHAT domain-containing protein [Oscillochloris sp.]
MNQPEAREQVELEWRVTQLEGPLYSLAAALRIPDREMQSLDAVTVELPLEYLLEVNPSDYAGYLASLVFADMRLLEFTNVARESARSLGLPLRFVLILDHGAPQLQAIYWEQLATPEGEPLLVAEDVLFSRYVGEAEPSAPIWEPIRLRPRGEFRALAVIAAPNDFERHSLAPIYAELEYARLSSAFSAISFQSIGGSDPITPERLLRSLAEGYDILAITAHVSRSGDQALLWLQQESGAALQLPADTLAASLRELSQLPQLILLIQPSAAESPDGPNPDWDASLAAVNLAAAGIPALVSVPFRADNAADRFLAGLVPELREHGRIDRAVAAARRMIGRESDWWAPVLYSRVRDGLIWAEPGDPAPIAQQYAAKGMPIQQSSDPYAAEAPVEQSSDPYAAAAPEARITQQTTDPYEGEAPHDLPIQQTTELNATSPIEQQYATEMPPIAQTIAPNAAEAPLEAERDPTPTTPVEATKDTPTAVTPHGPSREPPPATNGSDQVPAPPPFAPPRDNPITVIVNALEERYQPPDRTLEVEIRRSQVEVTYDNRRYRSPLDLDMTALLAAGLPRRYGALLFEAIFSNTAIPGFAATRLAYDRARTDAGDLLRIVLDIESNAAELNGLKWEYLCDPRRPNDPPLAAVERAPLYRLQGGGMAQPVEARPLKVLVAIGNPPGLGDPSSANTVLRNLAAIDPQQQEAIVQDALQRMSDAGLVEYRVLGGPAGPPATLKAIREAIEDGYHVLHLIAHGLMIKDAFHIVMEQDGNKLPFVPAEMLRNALAGQKLQLVLLAPCRSAQAANSDHDAGVSFGAMLVNGGVPAVIAMQDLVQIATIQHFTQHFYDDLARSGRVDTALAATRYALYSWLGDDDGDWGTPVLYLGVADGKLLDVDLAGANRLARRDPVIRGFAEPIAKNGDVARRVAERLEREGIAGLTPEHLRAISGAITAPAATSLLTVPGQQREQLADLRRPLQIDAAELQDYVENQGSRLLLPKALYKQVATALNIGKHIILIGPPGTGKTSLAQDIGRFAAHPLRRFTGDAVVTTASADWSTFDTVGGYVPAADQTLQFRPGVFLRAIGAGHWLIIDEINRAEIDKAFGELFTVLSGQPVALPYSVGPHQVQVIPAASGADPAKPWVPPTAKTPYDYVVHPNWRIIGAMNVYDRASLFAMSFAFMRRFAFIDMDVPEIALYDELVSRWIGQKDLSEGDRAQLLDRVRTLLTMRVLMERRALGPAIIKDMVQHVCARFGATDDTAVPDLLAEAFMLYAVPQLDALDQAAIVAIYQSLGDTFSDAPGVAYLLARIRVLYPHIRSDEW